MERPSATKVCPGAGFGPATQCTNDPVNAGGLRTFAEVQRQMHEVQAESLAFASEVRSLQRRLAEVRAQRRKPSNDKRNSELDSASVLLAQQDEQQARQTQAAQVMVESTNSGTSGGDASTAATTSDAAELPQHTLLLEDVASVQREHCSSACKDSWCSMRPATANKDVVAGHLLTEDSLGACTPLSSSTPKTLAGTTCPTWQTHVDRLREENNFLTEQLVEASMESAQNQECISKTRNALWRLAQDLRQRLHSGQAEQLSWSELLSSTQEALERLAADQLQQSHGSARCWLEKLASAGNLPGKESAALQKAHERETRKLRQECEQLRVHVRKSMEQANSTIMAMARRNLELEEELREAHSLLKEQSQQSQTLDSQGLSPATAPQQNEETPNRSSCKTGSIGSTAFQLSRRRSKSPRIRRLSLGSRSTVAAPATGCSSSSSSRAATPAAAARSASTSCLPLGVGDTPGRGEQRTALKKLGTPMEISPEESTRIVSPMPHGHRRHADPVAQMHQQQQQQQQQQVQHPRSLVPNCKDGLSPARRRLDSGIRGQSLADEMSRRTKQCNFRPNERRLSSKHALERSLDITAAELRRMQQEAISAVQ
mmetsp:Transcript_10089/g.19462  ORF Transcript_10089/g.19462 Transcript_10089/m.19462 type:complete len:602 (-) Transcript_10089:20-1825(-)